MAATYPKIKDLEMNLVLLKRAELVVTEKIHGTNFRILVPVGGTSDSISFGVRGARIKSGSFFEQFIDDVRSKISLDEVVARLDPRWNWILFGELFGPKIQKELPYLDEGVDIRFFDMMRNSVLLQYDEFTELAEKLAIPIVPELYRGVPRMSEFQQLVQEPSSLAKHFPREGIIIRDPSLELIDGQLPIAKFKNERFREKDYSFTVEDFTRLADEEEKVRVFVQKFVTEMRIKKMTDILREQGHFTRSARDIPALTAELMRDIQTEDAMYYDKLEQRMLSRLLPQRVNQLFSQLLQRGDFD